MLKSSLDEALNCVMNAAAEPMLLADRTGHVVLSNSPARALLGHDEAELVGLSIESLFAGCPRDERVAPAAAGDGEHGFESCCGATDTGLHRDSRAFALHITHSSVGDGLRLYVIQKQHQPLQTEATALPSEQQLQLFIDNAPAAIAMFDRDMRYIAASRRWLRDYRIAGDIVGRSHYEVFPGISEQWKAVYRRVLAGEALSSDGDPFQQADAATQWLKWEALPWRDTQGSISGVLIATEDVTERKQAERAAEEERMHLRQLIETIPDMVWMKDPEGHYLACNPAFQRLVGMDAAALIGKTDFDIGDPQAADNFRRLDREAIAAGRPVVNEVPVRFASDGTEGTLRTIKTPMFDADGRLVGVLGVGHDITALLQAKQTLTESELKYRTLVDSMADGVFVAQDYRFVFVNEAFSSMIGWSSGEIVGHSFADVVSRESLPQWIERFERRVGQGEEPPRCYDVQFKRKDGSLMWIELRATRSWYDGRRAVLGIVRDITDRRHAEEERDRLRSQLEQAQKMEAIGQVTGGIAHDFNNILAIMLGYTDMIAAQQDIMRDSAIAEYVGNVRQAGERARELISKMLQFSRDHGSIVVGVVSLQTAIEEVVAMLAPMISSSVEVTHGIDPQAEPVLGALVDVEQVLMNLVINARDAMGGSGQVVIRLERSRQWKAVCSSCQADVDGCYVSLTVSDSGGGIADEVIKRIFEPFFTTKAIGYGTGMGLPVVHGILHRFGGHIVMESVTGIGTQFTLLLVPANTQDLKAALTVPPPIVVESETVTNARVLVVDDEPQLCKLMALVLRKQGYEVISHTDPHAALAAFREDPHRFDVVITDQTMPGLSGMMLAEAIRGLRPSLPILLCSGYRDRADSEDPGEGPVDRYLEKPVSASMLLTCVGELLAGRRGAFVTN